MKYYTFKLFLLKTRKDFFLNLSSAAVVIGALRVKNLSKTAKRRYEEKDIGVEGVEKSGPFSGF